MNVLSLRQSSDDFECVSKAEVFTFFNPIIDEKLSLIELKEIQQVSNQIETVVVF